MELIHTSPAEITCIETHGRFDEFLFFSSKEYVTSVGEHVTYKIEVSTDDLIDASSLFYHQDAEKLDGLVAKFCSRFDVDPNTAEEVISERQQLDNCDADDSWDIQLFTARAAKLLGFRGVAVSDEQGTAYMIDMLGREKELVKA